jgi:exopolysaccharide biosynthesis predicted pyruvyltransferase EpsI
LRIAQGALWIAKMHDELKNLLRSRNGQPITYVPNVGNGGDVFIAHATYQLFARLGMKYEIGNLSEIYPDRVVICGGGGNLVAPYRDIIDFIERNRTAWRELILLPHTIRCYGNSLATFDENCYVFCREKASYDFVKEYSPKARIFLSHDLAFSCDFSQTRRMMRYRRLRDAALFIRYFRSHMRIRTRRQQEFARAAAARVEPDILNAFRTDVEKTCLELPADNVDVSRVFEGPPPLPEKSLQTTYLMTSFLSRFRKVRTNRLHIGIMSAMLGLDVEFFDNNYGKNYDVFSHSMEGIFPNVKWCSNAR